MIDSDGRWAANYRHISERIAEWSGTPVHVAARFGVPETLKILLARYLQGGGSLDETDANGCTFLHLIAHHQHPDYQACWDIFLDWLKPPHIIDPNTLDSCGDAALHIAIRKRHLPISKTMWNPIIPLIETLKAAVNIRTITGATPLHLACQKGSFILVAYLLHKGANARLDDGFGQNALYWLCSRTQHRNQNRPRIFATLVRRMTLEDIEARRSDGQTARDLAVNSDAEYLEKERRFENCLNLDLDKPADSLSGFEKERNDINWSYMYCQAFEELHALIDCSLVIIKGKGSKKDLDFLKRIVGKHPHLQHWLGKRRRYQISKANS